MSDQTNNNVYTTKVVSNCPCTKEQWDKAQATIAEQQSALENLRYETDIAARHSESLRADLTLAREYHRGFADAVTLITRNGPL